MSFSWGNTNEEETSSVYSLLKWIVNQEKGMPHFILYYFSTANKFNEQIKVFNDRAVMILVIHISDYLKGLGIDMGLDDKVVYNIQGTQVNIANDNATINATQNNGIDGDKLKELIISMRDNLSAELSDEDRKDAEESIDIIEQELQSKKPNEETVKTRFKLLKRIDNGVKFASACCSLLTFTDKIHPFLEQIVPMFTSLL